MSRVSYTKAYAYVLHGHFDFIGHVDGMDVYCPSRDNVAYKPHEALFCRVGDNTRSFVQPPNLVVKGDRDIHEWCLEHGVTIADSTSPPTMRELSKAEEVTMPKASLIPFEFGGAPRLPKGEGEYPESCRHYVGFDPEHMRDVYICYAAGSTMRNNGWLCFNAGPSITDKGWVTSDYEDTKAWLNARGAVITEVEGGVKPYVLMTPSPTPAETELTEILVEANKTEETETTEAKPRITQDPITDTGFKIKRGDHPIWHYLGTVDGKVEVYSYTGMVTVTKYRWVTPYAGAAPNIESMLPSGAWSTEHSTMTGFNAALAASAGVPGVEIVSDSGSAARVRLQEVGAKRTKTKTKTTLVKEITPVAATKTSVTSTAVTLAKDSFEAIKAKLTGHSTEKQAIQIWSELGEVVAMAAKSGLYCLLYGPPGTGKTTLANTLAAQRTAEKNREVKHLPITLDQDMYSQSLIGQWVPQGGEAWKFADGPLFEAYKQGYVSSLNEINCASGGVLTMLYPVLDDRGVSRLITPTGVYEPHDDFYAIATTNVPIEELAIPEALMDRFPVRIAVDYPNPHAVVTLKMEALRTLTWDVYTGGHQLYRKVNFRQVRALDLLMDAGLSRSSAVKRIFPDPTIHKLVTSALAVGSA